MQIQPPTMMPADLGTELGEQELRRGQVAVALLWRQQHPYLCPCHDCWQFDVAMGAVFSAVEVAPRAGYAL